MNSGDQYLFSKSHCGISEGSSVVGGLRGTGEAFCPFPHFIASDPCLWIPQPGGGCYTLAQCWGMGTIAVIKTCTCALQT